MSQQASYFKIGVFVIFAVALSVSSVIVFGSGAFKPEPIRIETYFDTTVTGLEVGAKFLVRGVNFGDVESIQLARNAYGLEPSDPAFLQFGRVIVVVIAVAPEHMLDSDPEVRQVRLQQLIGEGLRLRFASQGLTGVAYLDGDFLDPEDYPPLEVPWEPRFPYIPSAPSTFDSIAESFSTIARNLEKVDFEATFDELNGLIADIRTTAENLNRSLSAEHLDQVVADIRAGIDSFKSSMESVQGVAESVENEIQSAEFRATITHLEEATAQMPAGVAELNSLLRRLNNYIAGSYTDVDITLSNLRLISDGIRQLTDMAKKYPSQILFGNPPNESRPGGDR